MSGKSKKYRKGNKDGSVFDKSSMAAVPQGSSNDKQVRVSFEFVHAGDEFCLSNAQREDVKQAMECLRKLTTLTWIQVLQTATKDPTKKTGLHWTEYDDSALNRPRPFNIAKDHTIAGIRASEKFRVFGFRKQAYFYVIWFDPDHQICDG